ncbi:MAG TPA: bile acid:sodium symporter family protein [Bacteroidales bacterium]|nr:bile acid:sodium symporter family protein [Bacteroidales bacterium]
MFLDYNYVDIIINIVLALIMLGIGLSLTINDFRNLFVRPRPLITALSVQLFLVPVVAFVIAFISGLSSEVRVGIVIISLCASGASSNLITHLFRGNVALAISMTTLNSFITLISIPLLANLALYVFMGVDREIHLPFWETIVQIFMITIIPAGAGVYLRRKTGDRAVKLEKPVKIILTLMLGFVFTIKIFFDKEYGGTGITFDETTELLPYLLLLNFGAMSLGFYVARKLKLAFKDQYTISIEVGLHNTALALLISGTILNSAAMEKPAVVYAMFSFFTAVIFVFIVKKAGQRKQKSEKT